MINKSTKILIVGLGVIGAGYAQALTSKGYDVSCITLNSNDIDYAIKKGMIKKGYTRVEPSVVAEAKLIIFALYPSVFLKWIESYGELITKGTLVTDVCGVKSEIVDRVQSLLDGRAEFIAAHPMAGREKMGVEYADPRIFVGANYIVTPTEKNTEESILACEELGRILGFGRISRLSPKEHDEMIAFLSQLTHCIAISLMTCNTHEGLERYTGDSFRDLTRIAKINEKMWSELFLMNRTALLKQMDAFIDDFTQLRNLIELADREEIMKKMILSTERRSLFDRTKEN